MRPGRQAKPAHRARKISATGEFHNSSPFSSKKFRSNLRTIDTASTLKLPSEAKQVADVNKAELLDHLASPDAEQSTQERSH